jgi:hypothetical protein
LSAGNASRWAAKSHTCNHIFDQNEESKQICPLDVDWVFINGENGNVRRRIDATKTEFAAVAKPKRLKRFINGKNGSM